jgi:hypothetical protein
MSRTRLSVIAVAVFLAAGLGAGLGVGLSGSSGQSPTQAATAQLASVRSGCQLWLGATSAHAGTVEWCSDMTEWMSHYMARQGAEPQMMWGNPGRLGVTCKQWLTKNPPTGIRGSKSWCKSMVAWMSSHVGSWTSRGCWDDWMMRGSMMGG